MTTYINIRRLTLRSQFCFDKTFIGGQDVTIVITYTDLVDFAIQIKATNGPCRFKESISRKCFATYATCIHHSDHIPLSDEILVCILYHDLLYIILFHILHFKLIYFY